MAETRRRTRALRRYLGGAGFDAACLVAAPVAVFLALHVRAMARNVVLDTYFYGGYAIDGPDMMRRLGAGNYFWPRVGFILPDRLFVDIAGPMAGFFAFRYALALVATVPLYLVMRRSFGRATAWIAVLGVLTCPVVLAAWGSDYPDSSAVSYLIAAAACLLMPARTGAARVAWCGAGGALLALAVLSQAVAALMAVAIVAGWLVSARADVGRRLRHELAAGVVGAVVITAVLMVATQLELGRWDVITPTIAAIVHYRPVSGAVQFHSRTWRWLIDDIYLFSPPALVLAWTVLAWPRRGLARPPRAETAIAVATALGVTLYALAEWGARNWTLEYYLYSSMLWATACPLLVLTVRRAAAGVSRRPSRAALAATAAAVLALPLLLRPFRDQLQVGFAVAVALVPLGVLAAVVARRGAQRAAVRTVSAAALAAAATLLVVGMPAVPTVFAGQVRYYVTPDYGAETFADATVELARYSVFSRLHELVPSAVAVPGGLLTWAPPRHSFLVDAASAQYLWILDALPATMPRLTASVLQELHRRRPRLLVLLSDTGAELVPAKDSLTAAGLSPRTLRSATLRDGAAVLHVEVVEIGA